MPRPRYIVCSETRIVDRETGLCTYCNVADGLTFSSSQDPRSVEPRDRISRAVRMYVSATWLRSTDSESQYDFEFETRIHIPGGKDPIPMTNGMFRFDKVSHRIDTAVLFPLVLPGKPEKGMGLGETPVKRRVTSELQPQLHITITNHTQPPTIALTRNIHPLGAIINSDAKRPVGNNILMQTLHGHRRQPLHNDDSPA